MYFELLINGISAIIAFYKIIKTALQDFHDLEMPFKTTI